MVKEVTPNVEESDMLLLKGNGKPKDALVSLAERNSIANPSAMSVREMLDAVQARWVKTGKPPVDHRMQVKDGVMPTSDDLVDLVELGLIKARRASHIHGVRFDHAVVTAAAASATLRRMDFLAGEIGAGVRVGSIWVLGSGRRLNPEKESNEALSKLIGMPWTGNGQTELEVAKDLIRYSGLRSVSAEFLGLAAEKANVADLARLVAENGLDGSCLVVSNQPYAEGQRLAFARGLREAGSRAFVAEVIADDASSSISLAVHLDNVAKSFYEEFLLRESASPL